MRRPRWAAAALAAAALVIAPLSPAPAPRLPALSAQPDAGIGFPLHTSGASILGANGAPVKLDFVNWYGAESPDYAVGGLEYQPVSEIIGQIVSMGFNGMRLPRSNQMWESNPVVPAALVAANPQFAGEHARTVFEQVVQDLANAGLDAAGSDTISSINSMDRVEVPGQSTTAGTSLDQWQANGGTNQEWTFVPAG